MSPAHVNKPRKKKKTWKSFFVHLPDGVTKKVSFIFKTMARVRKLTVLITVKLKYLEKCNNTNCYHMIRTCKGGSHVVGFCGSRHISQRYVNDITKI